MAIIRTRYQKLCQCCGKEFTAQRQTTKFCSHICNIKYYKAQKRKETIGIQAVKTDAEKRRSKIFKLEDKPILSISETATFIGVSRPTVYKYLKDEILHLAEMGGKRFILRSEIMEKFKLKKSDSVTPLQTEPAILDVYSLEEIQDKYKLGVNRILRIVKKHNIPKIKKRNKAYYCKKAIDKHLAYKLENNDILTWYTIEQIMEKFNMTQTAVYTFVSVNKIPKKQEGRTSFYSQEHVDIAKGVTEPEKANMISVPDAMTRYNMTRGSLYSLIRYHNIPKEKNGRTIFISQERLDEILTPKLYSNG